MAPYDSFARFTPFNEFEHKIVMIFQSSVIKLMELDADCAEVMWALDNPRGLNLSWNCY